MKEIKFFIILLGFSGLVALQSCKDCCEDPTNPDCDNYDPCWNYKPANADFGIYEVVGDGLGTRGEHILSETDTILATNGVIFNPKTDQKNVTWFLGLDTISQVELFKTGFPENSWITVTMVTKVDPSNCLTSEQLSDTLTKRFYVLQNCCDTAINKSNPWWGTWQGTDADNPEEIFTVSWGYIKYNGTSWFDFTGLPKGLPVQTPFYSIDIPPAASGIKVYPGYNALLMVDDGNHQAWDGFALNAVCTRAGNEVKIKYRFNNRPYQQWLKGEEEDVEPIEWVEKEWRGIKISNKVKTQ
jgi:hypothetical protein